jgi:multidrug efflux pump
VQIGWVIVGGMSLGTLLTLFVVPCVYTLIAGARNKPVPLGVDSHAPEHGRTPGQVATPESVG